MQFIKSGLSALTLIALIWVLNTKIGSVPPLGKFFDPSGGFWSNAETSTPKSFDLKLPGLQDKVSIYYDERRVPHIFAQNDHDLYFAQGYVTAKDRLFQMEIQVYDAAGRLTEIAGKAALEKDRRTRRLGMSFGAEAAIAEMEKDSTVKAVLDAYTDGVNAYVLNLSKADYPIEYKVLDFAPEYWTNLKTAHLLKTMTKMLAGGNGDVAMSNTTQFFGNNYVEKVFNTRPTLQDPIIPPSRKWDFNAITVQKPDTLFKPSISSDIIEFERFEGVGSNNWAVSGSKTESGYPILANDPHLGLTLPSIWYEVQLNAPGINSYGVTIQGVPGVIIGFNENIAWGVTNVAADVMDWYEIKFKDDTKTEYWHDNKWKYTTFRVEEFKIRGEESVLDTVVYTHHGPVTEVASFVNPDAEPIYHALRWIAHEPSSETTAFYKLNRAKNYDDYVEALSYFSAPAQNFAFASNEGDIALWVNGKFPNKWQYQGRTVSDGTDPLYDWQSWIPHEHNPHIKNPERGFVSSANQYSAAEDYPYYLGDSFAPFERGRRINDRLAEMDAITVKDMQELQMDNFSYLAATILPNMINWVNEKSLNETEQKWFNLLAEWDYYNNADLYEPTIFDTWWSIFRRSIYVDMYSKISAPLRVPSRDRLLDFLLDEHEFAFFEEINASNEKSFTDLATSSFKNAIERLFTLFEENSDEWLWGYYMENDISHLVDIPGFSELGVFTGGSYESVNANYQGHGPSWRMVVELGPEVKAYGVYPGGASGNPGSPNYTQMLEQWRTGGLFELHFFKNEPEAYNYKIQFSSK